MTIYKAYINPEINKEKYSVFYEKTCKLLQFHFPSSIHPNIQDEIDKYSLYLCSSDPPEKIVDKLTSNKSFQPWLISYLYILKFLIKEIFGPDLYPYTTKYVDSNKVWFFDKVNIVCCLLAHNFSFSNIEKILCKYFDGHISPSKDFYEPKYMFLKYMMKPEATTLPIIGRPKYPKDIALILKKYSKAKNKQRMNQLYQAPKLTKDEYSFIANLCKQYAPHKIELITKLNQ
jgi:hypothetical protein